MDNLTTIIKGIQNLPFYFTQKFTKLAAVIDLYLLADKNGEVNISARALSSRWMWNKDTVLVFIKTLQDLKIVSSHQRCRIFLNVEKQTKIGSKNMAKTSQKTTKSDDKSSQKLGQEKIGIPATSNTTSRTNSDIVTDKLVAEVKVTEESLEVNFATKVAQSTTRDCEAGGGKIKKQSVKKVKKPKKAPPKKKAPKELEDGEHSPTMAIGVHLICTGRTFANFGALTEHVKQNIRASRTLRFYTPRQIATACVAAMAESKELGYSTIHLSTISKKMSLCDVVSNKQSVRDFIDRRVARYEIEKGSWYKRNSTLIVKPSDVAEDANPSTA